MNIIKIFLILILIVIVASTSQAQNITQNETNDNPDDSWYDTHWGGDTGDNEYHDAPIVEEEPEEKSSGICSGVIMFGGIVFGIATPMMVYRGKFNYENKK